MTTPLWQGNFGWPEKPEPTVPESNLATPVPVPAAAVTHCPACRRALNDPGPGCSVCPPDPAKAFRTDGAVTPVVAPPTGSRWEKSQVTFGPFGRITMTVLVLLPIPVLILGAATGFALIGLGIWLLIVTPWALRDIWRTTRRRR